ncbi:MAG TPA: hypothetical protein VL132_21710 [Planctomycetaceae bacterium]|nr:hypothetical protein [Planctomycetaceae bacterium]
MLVPDSGLAAVAAGAEASFRIVLADQRGQQGVVPKHVVVQEVLVAQTEAEDSLLEPIDERMFKEVGIAIVSEAPGEAFDAAEAIFDLFKQQSAAVGSDSPAIKPGHAFAPAARLRTPRPPATLCFHKTASFELRKRVFANSLTSNEAGSVGNAVRNAGQLETTSGG